MATTSPAFTRGLRRSGSGRELPIHSFRPYPRKRESSSRFRLMPWVPAFARERRPLRRNGGLPPCAAQDQRIGPVAGAPCDRDRRAPFDGAAVVKFNAERERCGLQLTGLELADAVGWATTPRTPATAAGLSSGSRLFVHAPGNPAHAIRHRPLTGSLSRTSSARNLAPDQARGVPQGDTQTALRQATLAFGNDDQALSSSSGTTSQASAT